MSIGDLNVNLFRDYPTCFRCDGIVTPLPRLGSDTGEFYLCSRCVILTDSRDPSAYAVPGPHGTHWRWHAREEADPEDLPRSRTDPAGPPPGKTSD